MILAKAGYSYISLYRQYIFSFLNNFFIELFSYYRMLAGDAPWSSTLTSLTCNTGTYNG